MGASEQEIYDVVGIGFGPSNLSLAIALEETPGECPETSAHRSVLRAAASRRLTPQYAAVDDHAGSFLKDLATFRNPQSSFSFVSYLHSAGWRTSRAPRRSFRVGTISISTWSGRPPTPGFVQKRLLTSQDQ